MLNETNSLRSGESPELAVVIWDVTRRNSLLVQGVDAGSYLHSQLSNDIKALAPGESCQSFVLEPTGKVDALVRVTRLAHNLKVSTADHLDAYLVDSDANDEDFGRLIRRLERFKIRVKADFVTQQLFMMTALLVDPRAESGLADAESAESGPRLSQQQLCSDLAGFPDEALDLIVVDGWWGNGQVLDVFLLFAGEQSNDEVPTRILTAVTQALANSGWAVRRAERQEIESWRVRSGWPAMGSEIRPEETIPAATGIVGRAVSFTKGCYPGQELVERMDSRGSSAPKSLRVIPLAELGSVQPGDAISTKGSEVGVVTSVTKDFVLAYVLRSVDLGVVVGSS